MRLAELHRHFLSLRRKASRLAPSRANCAVSTHWIAWNVALEAAVSIADEIARQPATSTADLIVKVEALRWWCTQFDAFSDREGFRRLAALERDIKQVVRVALAPKDG
ncbi:MAG TPA: hypothetical protein VG757_04895 [Devosia sp.]|nr:hypothetical protein [Devosia sp.]